MNDRLGGPVQPVFGSKTMSHTHNRPFVTIALAGLTVLAICSSPVAHEADAAEPFGPVEARTFIEKPGTAIEVPGADCHWNSDYLFIKGPNVASAKAIDVSPQVWTREGGVPTSDCVAPNCLQLFVSIDKKPTAGTRTVTLKHADGRKITTTFDVVANKGRCDKQ
jgi:hypothetical protein